MRLRLTEKKEKPLEEWNNKDFLIYFSKCLENVGCIGGLKIPPIAWVGYLSKMKGLRSKLNINNQDYKCFIDTLFSSKFRKNNFIPSFGCIASEKFFNLYKKSPELSAEYFEARREELYKNNEFFKSLD